MLLGLGRAHRASGGLGQPSTCTNTPSWLCQVSWPDPQAHGGEQHRQAYLINLLNPPIDAIERPAICDVKHQDHTLRRETRLTMQDTGATRPGSHGSTRSSSCEWTATWLVLFSDTPRAPDMLPHVKVTRGVGREKCGRSQGHPQGWMHTQVHAGTHAAPVHRAEPHADAHQVLRVHARAHASACRRARCTQVPETQESSSCPMQQCASTLPAHRRRLGSLHHCSQPGCGYLCAPRVGAEDGAEPPLA